MALIRCPECKQPVSSTISTCPHCGYIISDAEKIAALEEALNNPVSFEKNDPVPLAQLNTLEVEATFSMNGRGPYQGKLKLMNDTIYYKNSDFNWLAFWLAFLFLTVIGAFIIGALVPTGWEKMLSKSDIKSYSKKNIKYYKNKDETKEALVLCTKENRLYYLSPELFPNWESYFNSLSLDELSDDEYNALTTKPEKYRPDNPALVAFLVIFALIVFVTGIILLVLGLNGYLS